MHRKPLQQTLFLSTWPTKDLCDINLLILLPKV